MTRRLLRLVAASFAVALAALLLTAHGVSAMNTARLEVQRAAEQEVGRSVHGSGADVALVTSAWRAAGVDVTGLRTVEDLAGACVPIRLAGGGSVRPAPGDYVVAAAPGHGLRTGMLVSSVDAVVVDAGRGRVAMLPLPALLADPVAGSPGPAQRAGGWLGVCRLPPQRWPGGVDDVSLPAGSVALWDPGRTAAHLHWAFAHPRDVDGSWSHSLALAAQSGAVSLSHLAAGVVGRAADGLRFLLDHAGPTGAALVALVGLLGRTFDGRAINHFLTTVVFGALLLIPPVRWTVLVVVGVSALASGLGVPWVGRAARWGLGVARGVVSFTVGVVTGIDDSAQVPVGGVALALLSDVLVAAKPLAVGRAAIGVLGRMAPAAAVRLTEVAARLRTALPGLPRVAAWTRSAIVGERGVLSALSHATDLIGLRPGTIVHALAWTWRAVRGGSAVAPQVAAAGWRWPARLVPALDWVSLAWRRSSLGPDLAYHTADGLRWLGTRLRVTAGAAGMPALEIAGRRAALLTDVAGAAEGAARRMDNFAHLTHLHSGARTLSSLAAGGGVPSLRPASMPNLPDPPAVPAAARSGLAVPPAPPPLVVPTVRVPPPLVSRAVPVPGSASAWPLPPVPDPFSAAAAVVQSANAASPLRTTRP